MRMACCLGAYPPDHIEPGDDTVPALSPIKGSTYDPNVGDTSSLPYDFGVTGSWDTGQSAGSSTAQSTGQDAGNYSGELPGITVTAQRYNPPSLWPWAVGLLALVTMKGKRSWQG